MAGCAITLVDLGTWEKGRGCISGIKGQWEWLVLVKRKKTFPCSFCGSIEREVTLLFSGKSLNLLLPALGPLVTTSSALSKLRVQNHPLRLAWSLQVTGVCRITILVTLVACPCDIFSPAVPRGV